jgi:large subunit ribosomal protein L9
MATRILLLEDVEHVGIKGEITTVKPGYAYNFLIPKKKALIADANAIRRQARLQEERKQKALQDRKASEEIAARLEGQILTFEVKVDHDGHMYGSVSQLDIVHAIHKEMGMELDRRAVQLQHPIKQVGAYDIAVRLKEGVETLIHVKVSSEHSQE